MNFKEAKEELLLNIASARVGSAPAHAVLLHNDEVGFYTELHTGFPGNCCCGEHEDFLWREDFGTDSRAVRGLRQNELFEHRQVKDAIKNWR